MLEKKNVNPVAVIWALFLFFESHNIGNFLDISVALGPACVSGQLGVLYVASQLPDLMFPGWIPTIKCSVFSMFSLLGRKKSVSLL